MYFNAKNTHLFQSGNKNNLVTNQPVDILQDNFTILVRFKPDVKKFREIMGTESTYLPSCLVGKNGMHAGLFFVSGYDNLKKFNAKVSFEWWEHCEKQKKDIVKYVQLPVGEGTGISLDKPLDAAVVKEGNKITLSIGEFTAKQDIGNVVDYSNAFTWIGAANRLNPDHNHIFYGDIDLLHITEEVMPQKFIDIFFTNFNSFVKNIAKTDVFKTFFTTNFSAVTPYKIKDFSYNSNHPIKYSKKWHS
tara:strand:+ start:11225 stop:11965 length:741 start_codon:yes stop_codon:yes gene_type:complete